MRLVAVCTPNIGSHRLPARRVVKDEDSKSYIDYSRKWSTIFLKKLALDQAIVEGNVLILRHVRQSGLTRQQCAARIMARSWKKAATHDESMHSDISIDGVSSSTRHSVHNNLATHSQTDFTNIVF